MRTAFARWMGAIVAGSALLVATAHCGEEEACTGPDCPAQCGNGTCDAGECGTCSDCKPADCETCGNGVCDAKLESCATCSADCGSCSECKDNSPDLGPPQPVTADPSCEFLDPTYCAFPFPSDWFTVADPTKDTGRRLAVPSSALPKNQAGKPIEIDDLTRVDGFSPVQSAILRIPGLSLQITRAPTLTSMHRSLELDSPLVIIDADSGERQLAWMEYDAQALDPATQAVYIRPGGAFKEGHRYIIALRNLKDFSGGKLEATDAFRAYRDCHGTADPVVEGRRDSMEGILAKLAEHGVKRSELYLAWDFTVTSKRDMLGRLKHMRDETFAALPGTTVPKFTIKEVNDDSGQPFVHRVIRGSFDVPNYLRLAPLPGIGGRLVLDADGKPQRQIPADYTATFTCIVPKSAVKDGKGVRGRPMMYGHQVLETQEAIFNSNVQKLSFDQNITVCATDLLGLSEGDALSIATVLLDGSNFPTIPDRAQQSVLNMLLLNRLMKSPTGFISNDAFRIGADLAPSYDNEEIFYFGENYGGTLGAMLLAYSKEIKRGAFAIHGTGFGVVLPRSQDYEPYKGILASSYPKELDRALIFAVLQIPWDRGEVASVSAHLTEDTVDADTPPKKILLHMAFGDHVVTNIATEQFARILKAKMPSPALDPGRSLDQKPLFGIEPIPAFPYDGPAGFVVWDNGSLPAPPINVAPSEGIDPHGAPGETPAARRQIGEFLRKDGAILDVCGGQPCKTE